MSQSEPVNILMVDDQPAKLLTYETILQDLGENLIGVGSGREALEQLLKKQFAMILVDVYMPDQDGFELVETIRQHPRFQKIPIIFVSAVQLSDLEKHKGYMSGAVDFVSVPVVPVVLRAKVAVFAELFRKTRDLERFNHDLEARVLERTEELRKTQQTLMDLDRRKDEFLAILAHELRNPLAPMQSSLDVLRILKRDEPEITEISETLGRQLKLMTHLIDDLMDMSRITRNRLELKKEVVSFHSVVRQAIEMVEGKIAFHGHDLQVKWESEDREIAVDAIRLSQVIANLLNNACKYTRKGGRISLTAKAADHELTVTVEDSGIGVDPDDSQAIFEPFYQAAHAKEMAHGGLGIGLALAKKIVDLHGGQISVSSSGRGQGSTFEVSIPITSTQELEEVLEAEPPKQALAPSARKVLVVDDNVDAALTLTKLLQVLGWDVATGYDGAMACQLAESFQPEIVFLDIGMPNMNGFEAAGRIREMPGGKRMTIIALTGWGQSEDRRKTKESGFDGHLVKPVSMADLDLAMRTPSPRAVEEECV